MTARGSDVTEIGAMQGPRRKILRAIQAASHTITVSNNLRRDLISMGGDEAKITTLRNGVDVRRFKEQDRKIRRESWGVSGPVMLFAGWLIPRKRLDLVLDVTVEIPELTTVIVGDGPLRGKLEHQAKELGISGRVIFMGQRKPSEMPAVYSGADILLLPSDREGWANVLLEAMACGTPVVTRAVGGAPDLITNDNAGRVVDGDTGGMLGAAVKELIENPPARADTRAFAAGFDWTGTSEGQKKIFHTAIDEFKSRSRIEGFF